MQSQLERLAKLNAEYRRKTTLNQKRSENLIQEKTDLQAQLHDKEQQINRIKDRLKDQHDMQNSMEGAPSPRTSVCEGLTFLTSVHIYTISDRLHFNCEHQDLPCCNVMVGSDCTD